MFDTRFLEFKLDFSQTKNLAAGEFISSEDISVGGQVWRINCYPPGSRREKYGDHLSIYLHLVSKPSKSVKAIFQVFVLDRDGEPSFNHTRRFMKVYPLPKGMQEWGWHRFATGGDLKLLYMVDGVVTLACGVTVAAAGKYETLAVPPPDLVSHLGGLLDCATGSDVSFVVDGKEFPAHRAVLAARPPVFKAQLFGFLADARMSSITLHDIDPAAFKVMLRFIYTDCLPGDNELGDAPAPSAMLQDLLAMADRYALDRLKLFCAKKLWEYVSTDTVGVILHCAEMYNYPELKRNCIVFVAEEGNVKKTLLTDGFLQLVQTIPSIVAELRKKLGV
jgi:speckle-type POZ protein